MLKHCVFVNFQSQHTQAARDAILGGFAQIASDVPGMVDYCFGNNLDFENMSPDFQNGFIVTFTDRDAHLAYETHPKHIAMGAQLVSMCEGGVKGIIVFDLKV